MKFREQRGLLEESMATLVHLPATKGALVMHLRTLHPGIALSDIEVKPYIYDDRIDWDTHLVVWKGQVVGYTDGPIL